MEATATEKVDVGDSTDEAVKAQTRTVVARPRLPAAMAAASKPPKVVPPRRDATGVARRAIGRPTARRSYAADAKDGGTLPMSAPRPRRSDATVATDGGTLLISAPRRKKKLCWRCRNDDGDDGTVQASAFMAEDADECSNDLGRLEDRESAWQVGDEAWLCNRGTSTHMTPRADGMINYRECY